MNAAPALVDFLNTLPDGAPVGVAVSGGGDSMALLHMLAHAPCKLRACTVHHHLRDEAAAEAAFVAAFCAGHNIPHEVLDWHWDGQGNLQDNARRARYGLVGNWAQDHGLTHVALGHTADDNIETFLMGLSRGAGLDGLSGMRPSFARNGVTFHRPLLTTRRAALREYLALHGQVWQDDPSNDDPAYHRIRLRQARETLDALGLTPDSLLKSIGNLNAARRDIGTLLDREASGQVTLDHGDICIALDWLEGAPPEFQRRVLNAALRFVSGLDYAPRAAKLAQMTQDLEQTGTLHGCLFASAGGTLRISRELAAVSQTAVASTQMWDNRWRCRGPHTDRSLLRALGEDGIAACPNGWRGLGLPRASVLASPSVWEDGVLLGAPLAGWPNGWSVNLCAKPPEGLASILSH